MATDQSPADAGTFETRDDAGEGDAGLVRLWLSALDLADKDEKDWRKDAQDAIERFRDEKERKGARFNILYSSIQTQEPAMYNSTPIPDVRRRFGDEDPVGKIAAQVMERSLSHCIDEYDFDGVMESAVHDSLLPGRGVAMVVYDPVVNEATVDYETVRTEHVQWDDFRRGPAKRWSDVPWIAVRYRITREQAVALNKDIGARVTLDYVEKGADKDNKDVPDIFKRLTVWKIWDKSERKVLIIAPAWKDAPLSVQDDTLRLRDFFPFPEPLYDISDPTSLVPIIPYSMYKDQAEELDRVTRRIHSLVNVLRWRGIRPAHVEELARLKDAEDGELIPSESWDAIVMSQGSNPEKAIWLMPIDKLITVIKELVLQREAIKQNVFEISGLADIMRGETDPNETLGAQQIKAQWGSMRMQRRQRRVQRFARDLLRMKAEIIGEHFAPDTLAMISGIQLPTVEQKAAAQQQMQMAQATGQPPPPEVQQVMSAPTWDDIKKLLSSDGQRSFRIDIETDSTIQADLTRSQANMAQFVEGLGAFGQAMGPAVQAGVMPMDIVADLLTGFARNFKLGRQAEDALDRLGKQARQPQPPKPDPEMAKVEAEKERAGRELAMKEQETQARLQMDAQKLGIERERMAAEIDMKRQAQAEEFAMKREGMAQEQALKREMADTDLNMRREGFDLDSELKVRNQAMSEEGERRKVREAEGATIKPALDELMQTVQKIGSAAEAALKEVQDLKAEASQPVKMTVQRKGGRIVGGVREQGGRRTEIALQ